VPTTKQTAFDLKPNNLKGFDDYGALARWICDEIENALEARSHVEADLDYWHRIYEQARTRLATNRPKPDGADLTSPLGTQYVDSLHARTMQTIFGVEPIWTVEGWADSASKAPFVEEFHQWTAEDARVQSYCDRAIQNSWIDSVGVLEAYEETDYRPVRKTIWAQIETVLDEFQQPRAVFGEDGRPKFVMNKGQYVEVPAPQEGQPMLDAVAQVEIDSLEPVRVGPGYAVIDYRDFLVLPGHAADKREIWGYAKRLFRRYTYIKAKAEQGMYDTTACEAIGDDNEREQTLDDTRLGTTIARQEGRTADKELVEAAVLLNLDGQGERWWLLTVHRPTHTLLRLKYDDLGTQIGFGRFVRFVPLPRKNTVDGLSVIGHKLITLIEEHTAIRNIRADATALAAQAPIKVRQNAFYDPDEVPIGVGSVIYVRDMDEVQAMDLPEPPQSLNDWERVILDACERTMGVTDIASGVTASQDRTLGERQLQTGYSEVRMNLVVKRIQESMEELAQINHVIWKRVLATQGDMDIPQRAMAGIEARGLDVNLVPGGKMTADLLDGKFKFKPRGSVETADHNKLRADFAQMLQALTGAAQINPMVAASWQTPNAARALNERIVTLFKFPDRQAVLGMPGQESAATAGMLADPRIQALMSGGTPGQAAGAAPPATTAGPPPMGLEAAPQGAGVM
jgi:hypothetical protein